MPAQTSASVVPEYAIYDTAPPLVQYLVDGDGEPYDLTGATVRINITPTYSGYGQNDPSRMVDGALCQVEPDQVTFRGLVRWYPQSESLNRWGTFAYNFEVTWPDLTVQTISPKGDNTMVVRHPIGGMTYAAPH